MPSLHLFVDTNVFLSFYAFASDDIEQLKKLTGLMKSGTLKLYVSKQVAEEFHRNREVKLAKSIDEFGTVGNKALPRFLADYEESNAYRKALDDLQKAKNDLVQKARLDAGSKSFAVDDLVAALFTEAGLGATTPDIIERARLRRDLGNPPGKDNTLGDQINWEYLLDTVPDGVILHVVSKDGDYQCAFKNGKPHQYLVDEWKARKKGDLCLHKELKPFLNAHFESIKLEVDKEKSAAVVALATSGYFAMTHLAIAQLEPFLDILNLEDCNSLFQASLDNSQINWISTDSDVKAFYEKLLEKFMYQVEAELYHKVKELFQPEPQIQEAPDELEPAPF